MTLDFMEVVYASRSGDAIWKSIISDGYYARGSGLAKALSCRLGLH